MSWMADLSRQGLIEKAALLIVVIFSSTVLYYFYDHHWYPPDDGAYAHVADRMLNGDILNLDVHDVHMGYVNFLHAAAFKVFGNQMVSLRVPLAFFGVCQSIVLFFLFKKKGVDVAFVAAALITSLSFIQFLNPSANWYALFIVVLVLLCLEGLPDSYKYKVFFLGFLVMTLFLFRQLSGIIVGMGVVSALLYRNDQCASFKRAYLAKILFFIMFLGLLVYLIFKAHFSSALLFGVWPLMVVVVGFLRVCPDNDVVFREGGKFLLGACFSFCPLLLYHVYHGSVSGWYDDTVVSAILLTDLPFIREGSFFQYLVYCFYSVFSLPSLSVFLNVVFWIFLILASPVLGCMLLSAFRGKVSVRVYSVPIVCVFYGVVTAHFQIPIYLFYSVGLTLCGILWVADLSDLYRRFSMQLVMILICFVGVFYQAAQPLSRSVKDVLTGVRVVEQEYFLAGNVQLWVEKEDFYKYQKIKDVVRDNLKERETVFVFPSNAEIYYVTGRDNPFSFFNSALGVYSEIQFEEVMSVFKYNPPSMVFNSPDDKYNTVYSLSILEYVKANYRFIDNVGGIDIYILINENLKS